MRKASRVRHRRGTTSDDPEQEKVLERRCATPDVGPFAPHGLKPESASSAPMLQRIVTGGQAGVDRGALDAALDAGFPCGGWCPADRVAEDGRIPDRYPVTPLPGAGYRQRTLRNVQDSDATAILYFGQIEGGTLATRDFCISEGKPLVCINAEASSAESAADQVVAFIAAHRIATLSVAGPRASRVPSGHDYAYTVIRRVLTLK